MTKEALKLALETLEVANSCVDGYYIPKGKTHLPEIELAITALKEALANEALDKMAENARELGLDYEPAQRIWVGLTDEDFLEACQIAERGNYLVAFQRIQAKLRSKNESKN